MGEIYDHDSSSKTHTGQQEDKCAAAVIRLDQIARKYDTYEDFLDSQVTEMDMFYLEDRTIARTIKELGFHGNTEKITREQFTEKKAELAISKKIEEFKSGAKYLYTDRDVFLLELARREEANLNGRLVTIIYIRDRNAKGQEISSFVDFTQRLHEDDFASIFAGRERLVPRLTDLSHYNWDTNVTQSNNTPNFDIIYLGQRGIKLKCKKDRRMIHVDPNRKTKDPNVEDTTRTLLRSRHYAQVVLFDHFIRFWAKEEDCDSTEQFLPAQESEDNQAFTKPSLDLYDTVTAAIFQDDILEVAKNALGGNMHQVHRGEWAPADILEVNKPHQEISGDNVKPPPPVSIEESILGTMRDLYDAHKGDVSFGTLGNFTFIQMIEQLRCLLPENARQRTDQEITKINSHTTQSTLPKSKSTGKLSGVIVDVDALLEEHKDSLTDLSATTEINQPEVLGGDGVKNVIIGPHHHQGHEAPPDELFPGRNDRSFFNPGPHVDAIKTLYLQNSLNLENRKITLEPVSTDDKNKFDSQTENATALQKVRVEEKSFYRSGNNYEGFNEQSEYFKQLEARMENIFHGKTRPDLDSAAPLYPEVIQLPKDKSLGTTPTPILTDSKRKAAD